MRKLLLLFMVFICLLSCKTNRISNGKRVGLWIESDKVEGAIYTSRGRYKKGMEVGHWRYLMNDKIIKTEKYRDSICLTTLYHPNGIKKLQGKTQLRLEGKYLHWFYIGEWHQYDDHGKLLNVANYENGKLVDKVL